MRQNRLHRERPHIKKKVRFATVSYIYQSMLKPVFFKLDPERIHDTMTAAGIFLGSKALFRGLASAFFNYQNPVLEQSILGIKFRNPIGLAAGFDKDAQLVKIMPSVGFGFEEVGSVTGEPCKGNELPRLWRLKSSKSLMVYYGLKNDGCEVVAQRLSGMQPQIPVGTSIAKTNSKDTVDRARGIADYAKAFRAFAEIGDYFTVNISCPNAFGGQPFTDAESFDQLMTELDKIETQKPVFVKLSPDLSEAEVDALIEVSDRHRVHGFVATNLTKNRTNPNIKDLHVPVNGGMSGKVVEELSNKLISHIWQKTHARYVIMGLGGVFSAEDAYKKIKLGSSLVQLITGMIFEGPQLIGEINHGLVQLLQRDGYSNVSEAIGTETYTA